MAEAMKSEIDSMHSNQVWTLVDPPEGSALGLVHGQKNTKNKKKFKIKKCGIKGRNFTHKKDHWRGGFELFKDRKLRDNLKIQFKKFLTKETLESK